MLNILNRILNPNSVASVPPVNILQTASKPQISRLPKVNMSGFSSVKSEVISEEEGTGKRMVKLVMVTESNNNKYYDMEDNEDGTFTVTYGRIGNAGTRRDYPISLWDRKRREKINKGYKDTTYLFAEKSESAEFADLDDKTIQALINDLMAFAKDSVQKNYRISSEEVSMQQVSEAQHILDTLSASVQMNMDVSDFNWHLRELYAVIPRKMNNVRKHLIEAPQSQEDIALIEEKLAEEQATLDVMRGQVEMHKKQDEPAAPQQTLLDAFGMQIESVTEPELIKEIKKMMKDKSGHFRRAYKVVNVRTQGQFDAHIAAAEDKTTNLFWHGSRNENWLSILKTGLVLRPASAVINGKMFGYGLYFADKFAKSLNYTSLRGSYWARGNQNKAYLALYEVHTGKALKIKKHQPWCGSLSAENLKKKGKKYNSVFAQGGVDLINNEYIVYNENQCTVRYIIEVN